jgi:hypothetical protein
MEHISLRPAVRINFGKKGKSRLVSSVSEASYCLASDKWPQCTGPLQIAAARALRMVRLGRTTPADARQAFALAAKEAGILVHERGNNSKSGWRAPTGAELPAVYR